MAPGLSTRASSTGVNGAARALSLIKRSSRRTAGVANKSVWISTTNRSISVDRSASSHTTTTHNNPNIPPSSLFLQPAPTSPEDPSLTGCDIVAPLVSPSCCSVFSRHYRPPRLGPMAFNSASYSTASSDISTPRSSSPSYSIASARSSQTSISKRMSISSRRSLTQFNPMSSVDITAIEEQMKMASLDSLRGYSQSHFGEVQQYRPTEYVSKSSACGYQVLREPAWNKGKSLSHLIFSLHVN